MNDLQYEQERREEATRCANRANEAARVMARQLNAANKTIAIQERHLADLVQASAELLREADEDGITAEGVERLIAAIERSTGWPWQETPRPTNAARCQR